MVGHLNYSSRLLDGGYAANSDGFDVLQDAGTVFNLNTDQSKVSPVDVANVVRGTEVQLPGSAVVAMGGSTAAVTDRAAGSVWITSVQDLPGFSDQSVEPVVTGSAGVVAAVSSNDRVIVADIKAGAVSTFAVGSDGSVADPEMVQVEGLDSFGDSQVAAVGDQAVVFEPESGRIVLPDGKTVQLPDAAGGKLQQSGPASSFVVVATPSSLIKQPLAGGEPTIQPLEATGVQAAPVQLDGCVHAAWAGSAVYVRDCADDASDQRQEIPELSAESELVFRVNRNVVVLNDVNGGNVWLVQQNMELVNNWGDIIPPKQESDEEDEESASENPVNTLPDRTGENRPPVAEDDSYGARAGRTTILNVLTNDTDPDGDLLTTRLSGDQPAAGSVQPIYNGAGLQIVVPDDAPVGTATFTYEVDDGRGGSDSAQVSVDIRGAESNKPPNPLRPTKILVEEGKAVSQNILSNWMDADGDDLFLVSAEPTPDGDQVRTRSDGLLTFRDVGKGQGVKEVKIVVSDGRDETSGVVSFDVRASGTLPPVVNFDHFTAVVGQESQLTPLQNDLDPAGGQLSLAKAELAGGEAAVTPDYDTGTVSFTPQAAGTYYVEYLVTNGPQSASGLIRVDAKAEGADGAPIAVRDVALLPRNGDVLVDVLGNDSDPTGGVLVVQSVDVPAGSPIDVAVLDHNVLRIHDVRGLNQQATITYTVSNGKASAKGEVSVLSVEGPETLLPPQANPDEVTVRAGDVVNIPVLENDTHPNGDELTLSPVLAQGIDLADGRVFASENSLRFVAGPTAKTVYAIYEVLDSTGQTDSAEVRINIRPLDAANTPPVPKNLDARVIAGSTVRIPVPLDGIDADGDSSFLAGIDVAPKMGAAVPGPNYIDFTASSAGAGTDTFTYTVRDRLGAENTGTVQVGVAPAAEANQKPIAVNDGAVLRPGRAIAVDALRNDSDPDGDPIALNPEAVAATPEEMAPEVVEGRVLFRAPEAEGDFSVRYGIEDNRGGAANGNINVTVDQNAPLLLPIARDDRVEPEETRGQTAVDVPVLKNDEDPDGVAEDLVVSVDAADVTASVGNEGVVRVELSEQAQTIPYTVEDIDGGVATAVIWVPGLSEQYPTLINDAPIDVKAGEELTLNLGDLVEVREGRTPRVTVAEKVTAIGTSNANDWVADPSTLRYAADIDYAGRGSITFEVTDGSGPDDPAGLASTLTVLTNVIPAEESPNMPPTLDSGSLDVAIAEPAVTLDLTGLASDPNPEDSLEFSLTGDRPAGFDVSFDGSVLSVAAQDGAAVGQTGTVGISVTDGEDTANSTVSLTVLASSRPLPVANDDEVPDAVQGEPVSVDVLSNDVNPFPEEPLQILDVVADGNGSVSQQGDSVLVTPAASFVGTMTVQYTVQDKTGELSRVDTGQILLTVKGKPGAPSTPVVESTRSETVVLSWDPPADNGSPITGYTVTGTVGFTQECAATTCTLTGLTNNVEYVFTVTAANDVGTSDPSPESAVARPDTQPEQPAPPVLKFGDGAVTVNWTPPANEGSPIEGYDLQISPAPPNGATQRSATASPLTWEGLENGTAYKVRVQARNAAPEPSDWSDYSAAETPAGLPGTPAAPTTRRAQSVGTQSQLVVDWADVTPNGAEVTKYQVQEFQGGTLTRTLAEVTVSEQTIDVPNAEADYTYAVRAYNKAGWTEYGAQSAPRRAVGAPSAPAAPRLTETRTGGVGEHVRIEFAELTPEQRNGSRASEISYLARFSDGRSLTVTNGQEVGGFRNGSQVWAVVQAVGTTDGSSYSSGDSPRSNTVVPYGKPLAPRASSGKSARGDMEVHFNWSAQADNGRRVVEVQHRRLHPTTVWVSRGTSGNVSYKVGNYGDTETVEFKACDETGQCSNSTVVTGTAGDAPPPPEPPRQTEWKITAGGPGLQTGHRTCMDPANGTNWTGSDCRGNHWLGYGETIVSKCYIQRSSGAWYKQFSGPNTYANNDGLHVRGNTTTQGANPPAGMPRC
ncbi:tandem-95 repeat protein [Arthrobacter sp. JZ12]|uniref:Ig-like domain-containing protein n=1 Tax=Arthrobacter sp. JZ12 TaxID=2654190 RepID=UPI002B497242|nr:Ig-like domain-containing protein [Arthrobacter sp. JZ12]WRH24511.1 tandem-95 repeat protein [Arthrobacter sp. JZ12]